MIEEPSVGRMLLEISQIIEEVRALDVSNGVNLYLTPIVSKEKIVLDLGPRSAERILGCIEAELLNVQAAWERRL